MEMLVLPGTDLPSWAESLLDGETIVLDDLHNSEYHGTRALVSKSGLDVFARSPAHYRYYLSQQHVEEDKRSDALLIGSAFHSLVLEPLSFSKEYGQLPDFGDMRSSKNRAFRDTYIDAQMGGRIPLTGPQWKLIHGMREGLMRNKRIRRILENGQPEVTCAAIDPGTGVPRKVRWDWVYELDGIGLDLKSALDGSPDVWAREAGKRRYHVQDCYYSDTSRLAGLDIDVAGFAVMEKEEPFVSGLYTFGPTSRLAGEIEYQRDLVGIAECADADEWPGYTKDGVTEIELPKWATRATESIT